MSNPNNFHNVLSRIAEAARSAEAIWLVGGSTGLMMRGMELERPPRDLDLYADEQDARRLHERLREYAIDQQELNISGIYRSLLSHYVIEGVPVELVGGFVIQSGEDRYAVQVSEVLAPLRYVVRVDGSEIGVVPLAHEMWFNQLRKRQDRIQMIAETVKAEQDLHKEAFAAIEKANRLSPSSLAYMHDLIGNLRNEGPQ
ncbi:nucleotidyltransferase domain-containing protein [Paenibacillus nasutitermitis]|uniref:Uncharacterized protein n=1 Tax=Paenibacillus nasutitermitis TaxID=1652958 RepID=A0A916Z088_9BACL|nr:hypothetical protein [Paenibacillus nasutitermitis]GGD69290.1 hypothetical protein GCM10010911_28940 [Paenibacillus nasutitermitis]